MIVFNNLVLYCEIHVHFIIQCQYGVLMAVFKCSTGDGYCVVQGFYSMHILNDYDCPVLNLSKNIFIISSSNVRRPVNIVHECTPTCQFQETAVASRTIEREDVSSNKLVFMHDRQNSMYCFNIYCV